MLFRSSPALQRLHQTYTDAIKKTLADVEMKLKRKTPERTDVDTTLLTASDERVADLIDRLLERATQRTTEEKAQRPLEGMQPSLFDVEAQKKIAEGAEKTVLPEKAAPTARGELPIEQAQRLMEEAQSLRASLAEYNDTIKRAGRPTDPVKIARSLFGKSATARTLDSIENMMAALPADQAQRLLDQARQDPSWL